MIAKLLGIKRVNFKNNNGEVISGITGHFAFEEEGVEGLCTEKFWIREGINFPKDTKINDMVNISFDRKGRIEMIAKTN